MKELFNHIVAYLELALKFLVVHIMTVEGIIVLLFGMFFLGLIARIRS